MERGEGPSHPAFPASRSLRLFMGLLHKLGFFLPFSFLFSSFSSLLLQIELFKCIVWQPQIPAFPSLSPLAAISFSPFCSCIFRIISRVVPVAFIEICTKKILLQCHHFSPGRRFMGAGRHPWRGGSAGRKKGRRGRECGGKAKDARSWGAGRLHGGGRTRGQPCSSTGDTRGDMDTTHVGVEGFSVGVV